jgi:hypothetical protein
MRRIHDHSDCKRLTELVSGQPKTDHKARMARPFCKYVYHSGLRRRPRDAGQCNSVLIGNMRYPRIESWNLLPPASNLLLPSSETSLIKLSSATQSSLLSSRTSEHCESAERRVITKTYF